MVVAKKIDPCDARGATRRMDRWSARVSHTRASHSARQRSPSVNLLLPESGRFASFAELNVLKGKGLSWKPTSSREADWGNDKAPQSPNPSFPDTETNTAFRKSPLPRQACEGRCIGRTPIIGSDVSMSSVQMGDKKEPLYACSGRSSVRSCSSIGASGLD